MDDGWDDWDGDGEDASPCDEVDCWDEVDSWEEDWDDGGALGDLAPGPHASGGRGSGWSGLQMGTVAAVAGHLLDRQADRIVAALRDASPPPPPVAPSPVPPTRQRSGDVDWAAPPLRLGDPLTRSRLAVTIAVRLGARRSLTMVARPHPSASRRAGRAPVSVLVFAHGGRAEVRVRLVVEGGTAVLARLRPVFAAPPGRTDAGAVFDDPAAAVDAIAWALERCGAALEDFRWDGGA